jgi:zeaxanthin glucosyltransferase
VLESLAEGVPLVALPQGNDQPGVAARVAAKGAGIVIRRSKINAQRLRTAVRSVLEDSSYRLAARNLQGAIQKIDGLEAAADIIEDSLNIRQSRQAA